MESVCARVSNVFGAPAFRDADSSETALELCQLEKQVSGQDFDYESANYTIEHILPQSPAQGWEAFNDRDLEQFVHRIGNETANLATKRVCPNPPIG